MAVIQDYHNDWQIQEEGEQFQPVVPSPSPIDTNSEVFDFLNGYKSNETLKGIIEQAINEAINSGGGIHTVIVELQEKLKELNGEEGAESIATPELDNNKEIIEFLKGFTNTQTLKQIIEDSQTEQMTDEDYEEIRNLIK